MQQDEHVCGVVIWHNVGHKLSCRMWHVLQWCNSTVRYISNHSVAVVNAHQNECTHQPLPVF